MILRVAHMLESLLGLVETGRVLKYVLTLKLAKWVLDAKSRSCLCRQAWYRSSTTLGKSQKNAHFKNKLELWDRLKQKYDWDKDDLDVTEVKVVSDRVSQHMQIPDEVPGVRVEAHVQPGIGAIHVPPVPTMSYLVAASRANDGLAPYT